MEVVRTVGRQSLKVTLPDGSQREAPSGATTADIAAAIGPGLARSAIAGRVSFAGHTQVYDLDRPLPGDCALKILTASDDDPDSLMVLRHSAAHVMAEAVCRLFPETKLVYGPPLEDGFYYDIDLGRSVSADDIPRIEAEMARVVQENRPFCRYEMPRVPAMEKLRDEGNRYKVDNAERAEGDTLSFYVTGENRGKDFEDLCRGPHIPRTGLIKAFKVRQVSRSHYRGDVNDQPLQRLYGTAFFKQASLAAYLEQLEQAKKRDHRVIGKELGLFAISEAVGSGLILWLPRGAVVRTQLQQYLTEEMLKLGYDLVYTPHVGQLGLYRTSGHYPYYEDSQYPAMFETERGKAIQGVLQLALRVKDRAGAERDQGLAAVRGMLRAVEGTWGTLEGLRGDAALEQVIERLYAALTDEPGYLLRPMNCPHHIQIYAARQRSYRDLPVRLAEYGTVYRFEQSGEISGMTRVRGFTQDDAHLFCTTDQLAAELATTVKLTRSVLETLGLHDYRVRLGLRDESSNKYVGSPENWKKAEAAIRQAAIESGMQYTEEPGEAAFYGPKIDFLVKDCIGRNWQLGTVQADYNLPERFDLTYIGSDNAPHRPVMVHRAPFGSMERFVGILIEHFAGAFPLWLSPVQVAVATVSEKSDEYASSVYQTVKAAGLRAELDTSSEKIGPKKHRLRNAKINYILVVGEQETAGRSVNVNDRDGRSVGNMTLDAFISACRTEVESKGRTRVGGA
ncbi:MAG: threonine--tRNA ligase [Planctomycetes bacterium]|nr:threonine--tRNA ligase [Planctomycetota bacterium]